MATPAPVIIDTDPGIDDAVALTFPDDIEPLRNGGPLVRAVASMVDRFMDHDTERHGRRCTSLHDALAVSYLLDPSILELRAHWVGVECAGALTRGMTVVDVRNFTKRPPNAHVAVDVDTRRFVELLVGRLGGR